MKLRELLVNLSTNEIGGAIINTYDDIVKHFVRRQWKYAGLDAGHFVEAVRRLVEHKLFGAGTPIAKGLTPFNEGVLGSYLKASGDESYRILIPRVLWALIALRNKRSIGHLGAVPASEIDASILLNGAKWVLSEIVRIESNLSEDETRELVTSIINRQEPAIWIEGDILRVLDITLDARDRALVLLAFVGNMSESRLREAVRYKNPTNFRKILKRLDEKSLISHSQNECVISPTGVSEAETILGRSQH